MDKSQFQSNILELIEGENLGLELMFVYKEEEDFEIVKPALDIKKLEPKLLKGYLKKIRNLCIETEENEYDLVNLDTFEANTKREVYYYNRVAIPLADKLYKEFTNAASVIDYDKNAHTLTGIWGIAVKIANEEKSVYLFRKNFPFNVIKKDKFYSIFFNNGALQLLEDEFLKITDDIDFIYTQNDKLVIFEKKIFEKYFNYHKAVETRAKNNLDILLNTGLFTTVTKLFDLVERGRETKRLLSINAGNPALSKTAKEIADFATKYQHKISLNDKEELIDFKSQKEAITFLKILSDDFLLSELTNNKYDAKGKEKV